MSVFALGAEQLSLSPLIDSLLLMETALGVREICTLSVFCHKYKNTRLCI